MLLKNSRVKGTHLICESPGMQAALSRAAKFSKSTAPVLVLGETGCGKEVVARYIHEMSPRRGAPWCAVNCGALPDSLLQSTLFGHERGAFTGADRVAPGVFERATGGTLFLDELGELSASAQAALLRVLETKSVSRLGATEERAVDVRVIAATHRDLRQMVTRGQFREDLFYRLSPLPILVPPLRQRTADIVPLAIMFLQRASIEAQKDVPRLSDALLTWLTEYHWPGNVRELGNAITHAVMNCASETLSINDLSGSMSVVHQQGLGDAAPQESETPDGLSFRQHIRNLEVALIMAALRATSGNQRRAAARLRIPLRTLVHKIHSYGLTGTKKPACGHSAGNLEEPNAYA